LEFQISNNHSYFEISNCHLFENLAVPHESQSHNFSNLNFPIMEEDCEDASTGLSQTTKDIQLLFAAFTQQMTTHMNDLHDRIAENEVRLCQKQEQFHRAMKEEMDELRSLVNVSQHPDVPTSSSSPGPSSMSTVPNVSSVTSAPSSQVSGLPSHTPSNSSTASLNTVDLHAQMMLMLTESFSKLTSVMVDQKSSDVKSDWPKFSGDAKKFRSWYLSILAQLSIHPWSELYDSSTNSVVTSTQNTSLNGKLYAKLIAALEGQALQDMISRSHLRANGILLLHEMVQTYKPTNVPEVLAAKAGEFWSKMKRAPHESVDVYYNRFRELLDELDQAEDKISTKSAMRQFIFTLGSDFEAIQNYYRIDNLPPAWNTTDWPTLLVLCRNYYNSVNPKGPSSRDSSTSEGYQQRMSQQKKVREWFLNPTKYCQEISQEQLRYPDKCIYHLTKSHPTEECSVKRECDKLRSKKNASPASSNLRASPAGQLRHLTEEVFADAVMPDDSCVDDDVSGNDTNEDTLLYFARVSNHYLRLVKNSDSSVPPSRHDFQFPIIADSGANYHMFRDRAFFTTLQPSSGSVFLGDGKTTLTIKGVGTVKCRIGSDTLIIPNVRYVPELSESIYSLFQHIQSPGHRLESSYDEGLHIIFPTFRTKAVIGQHDIYLNALPHDEASSLKLFTESTSSPMDTFCRDITEFQSKIQKETDCLDNILSDLRRYYSEIKTKRQLGLEVPAGFRRDSKHRTQFNIHTPPKKSTTLDSSSLKLLSESHPDSSSDFVHDTSPSGDDNEDSFSMIASEFSNTTQDSTHIPIIRSVDKVSSSIPQKVTFSEDLLRACVGFQRVDMLKKHFHTLYQPTVSLDHTPADAILDPGFYATLRKKDRNTTPVPRPLCFGDVVHLDIVFGPEISLGNIHYGLLCVDRFSRMTYLYPLQNLTGDIQRQLEQFFAHIGMVPKRIVTDFDTKLVGGLARTYLNSLLVHVNAAPPYRQDKNGLAERHWQTIVSMARNWLASAELPASFWFYAVRRAVEVVTIFLFLWKMVSCLLHLNWYITPNQIYGFYLNHLLLRLFVENVLGILI